MLLSVFVREGKCHASRLRWVRHCPYVGSFGKAEDKVNPHAVGSQVISREGNGHPCFLRVPCNFVS
jgi:hypothetical protein